MKMSLITCKFSLLEILDCNLDKTIAKSMIIHCENKAFMTMAINLQITQYTKHIAMYFHYIREKIDKRNI